MTFKTYNNGDEGSNTLKHMFEATEGKYKIPNLQKLGLCRFDDLVDLSNGDYILVMPTWRQWIAEPDILNKKESSNFSETQYFKRWNDFLSSKELYAMLEKYNKKLVFYPHRNMQKFIKSFYDLNNDRIIIAEFPKYDAHELLKKCSLLNDKCAVCSRGRL